MSTHIVEVFPVKLEKHPNADTLSIVRFLDYTIVTRTADWHDGKLACYIKPDFVVPADSEQFQFLAKSHKIVTVANVKGYRITVKRLRGVLSQGLLMPAPEGAKPGDNMLQTLGIVRYEPPEPGTPGTPGGPSREASETVPTGTYPKYDIESAYDYSKQLIDGEEIICTEKVHGSCAKFTFADGEMFCGSKNEWKKCEEKSWYWRALKAHPELENFCKNHPGLTVYGEVYGTQKGFSYGLEPGKICFVAFDISDTGRWIDHDEARVIGKDLPWVPEIYRGPWVKDFIFALAEGKSELAKKLNHDQIREGIVVKTIKERYNDYLGRVQVKIVSNAYLEKD